MLNRMKFNFLRNLNSERKNESHSDVSSLVSTVQKVMFRRLLAGFSRLKLENFAVGFKEDQLYLESQKHLIFSLLNNIHNESKVFETLNGTISTLLGYQGSEVLFVDKVHRTVWGYPSHVNQKE